VEAVVPFPVSDKPSCVIDSLLDVPISQMSHCFTPSCHPVGTPDTQSVVIRGIPPDRVLGLVNITCIAFAFMLCGPVTTCVTNIASR